MKIKDLKQYITHKNKLDQFMIFVCKDNYFLAEQYVDAICSNFSLQKRYVETIQETKNNALSLVFDFSQILNVIIVDEFAENLENYSEYFNCIVICKKIDKKISNDVEKFCIEFPELLDWQVKDYIKTNCKGLDQYDIDWLYSATEGNIYRITNEINKIKLFQINNQQEVLAALKYNSPDLYTQTLFNISDAVFKKDILTLIDYFLHKNSCDFDAFGLVYALLKTFKKMLFVLCNSGLTAEQIGITQKQYSGIKYYNQGLSKEYLEKSILFLSSIDERIKTGKLDIPKESLIDYIICNVISYNV